MQEKVIDLYTYKLQSLQIFVHVHGSRIKVPGECRISYTSHVFPSTLPLFRTCEHTGSKLDKNFSQLIHTMNPNTDSTQEIVSIKEIKQLNGCINDI